MLNHKKKRGTRSSHYCRKIYTLAQISKNRRQTTEHPVLGSDLVPIFGNLSQNKKLSELIISFSHNLKYENIWLFPAFKCIFQPITIQSNSQNCQAVLSWAEVFAERQNFVPTTVRRKAGRKSLLPFSDYCM